MYTCIYLYMHTRMYTMHLILYMHIYTHICTIYIYFYIVHTYTCIHMCISRERYQYQAINPLDLVSALLLTVSLSLFKLPANTSRLFPLSRLKHLSVMTLLASLE